MKNDRAEIIDMLERLVALMKAGGAGAETVKDVVEQLESWKGD